MRFHSLAISILLTVSTTVYAKQQGATAGLIMINGGKISPEGYNGLLKSIKDSYPGELAIETPSFLFDLAIPIFTTNAEIDKSFNALRKTLGADAPIFIAGHSLGGIAAQKYAASKKNVDGLILMGSGLLREFDGNFAIPTLQLNGQWDAQYKPMRSAESYFKWISPFPRNNTELRSENAMTQFPVVMLPDVTHMSFATYHKPPERVVKFDMYPTIPEKEAHERIAQVVNAFLTIHSKSTQETDKSAAASLLKEKVEESGLWLAPMLESMEAEGSFHLKPACDPATLSNGDDLPLPPVKPDPTCQSSSPLAADVQIAIANISSSPRFKLITGDAFLEDPHFKARFEVDKDCLTKTSVCTAKGTTVSWNMYEKNDIEKDRGNPFVSALEVRMKMKSNQFVRSLTSLDPKDGPDSNRDVLETDPLTFCRDQNKRIFEETYEKIPAKIRERYEKYGPKFEFVEDKRVSKGTDWLPSPLTFTLTSEGTVEIQSTTLITALKVPIIPGPRFAGQHYCKIISPARIVEWVYTDGLRPRLGLANKALADEPGAVKVVYEN